MSYIHALYMLTNSCGTDTEVISLYKLWIQNKLIAKLNNQIKSLSLIFEAKINPIYKEKHTKEIVDHVLQTNEM